MTDPEPAFRIVDDFLDEDAWTALWTHLQFDELHPVTRTSGAWKLDDGVPLGGQEIITPKRDAELVHDPDQPDRFPTGTPLDGVFEALLSAREAWEGVVGNAWERVTARIYIYPRGTALSWHSDDTERYAGAFAYYAHPHWNAHWGGELLIADGESPAMMGYRFETESYSEALLKSGTGRFIAPKPNRLVVLGSAPHAIAPVRESAGAAVRASISGFFLR